MKHLKRTYQCHENWNDFTTTEQGAFCKTCKIDVKDFSNMANHEIKSFLDNNANQHLCGKFGINQIEKFNNDSLLWGENNEQSFQSKFVFVLVITFGLTLFSCTNESDRQNIAMISEMINFPIEKKGLSNQLINKKDSVVSTIEPNNNIKNEIVYELPVIDKDLTFCGGSINENDTSLNDSIVDLLKITRDYIMGSFFYQPAEIDTTYKPLEDTISVKKENTVNLHFNSKVFPNPTTSQTNLVIDVKQKNNYLITLIDLNGNVLDEIYNDMLFEGEQRFNVNLNDYSNGFYLIYIQTKDYQESLKILKTD